MDHRYLLLLFFVTLFCSCQLPEGDGTEGHADHPEEKMLSLTRFSEKTELFVEFPPLVVGERSSFAVHLTRLSDFAPVEAGSVTVELTPKKGSLDASPKAFTVIKPTQPGIFRPVVIPTSTGVYTMRLRWTLDGREDLHELGEWEVYADAAAARNTPGGDESGEITLLKEQQWFLDFATAPVLTRSLRPGEALYGTLQRPPSANITLSAPLAGQLSSTANGWPQVGAPIQKGQLLAAISPRLSETTSDLASLNAALQQARLDLKHNQRELESLKDLLSKGVIPARRTLNQQREVSRARIALQTAQKRLKRHQQGQGTKENISEIQILAPVSGTLLNVSSVPGTFIEEGAPLFEIAEDRPLWLEIQVPERLHSAISAEIEGSFVLPGDPKRHEIRSSQRVPGVTAVDPIKRTFALRFEVADSGTSIPPGTHARVQLYLSASIKVLSIARDAVIHDGGQDIVFVMKNGESFERRPVRLGVRDGDYFEVKDGLSPGEWVVTRGAYIVKLAASSDKVPAHGHTH